MQAGVEADAITVLTPPGPDPLSDRAVALLKGVVRTVHDPDDRDRLAYLATTSQGRRVYLNRLMTDADVVVPIGRVGYDPVLGYRGPWSLLFPELSDRETARSYRSTTSSDWPDRDQPRPTLSEAAEVSWLLGTQFHLGIMAGTRGPAEVIAGLESVVRTDGSRLLDQAWTFESPTTAQLVVVGIGQPGVPSTLEHLAEGLANATRLVERGGKIVALSRASGTIGPAFRRLIDLDDPRLAPAALRGHETDADYTRRLPDRPRPGLGRRLPAQCPRLPAHRRLPAGSTGASRGGAASWPPAARACSSARPNAARARAAGETPDE